MTIFRRAKRRDETEPAIVDGLRKLGYQVRHQDFPDLLVRRRRDGRYFLLEIEGITKYRRRDAKQLEFLREWGIPVVKTLDAALLALNT